MHITAQGLHVRNDLYCVEWDVKITLLYHTIPTMEGLTANNRQTNTNKTTNKEKKYNERFMICSVYLSVV